MFTGNDESNAALTQAFVLFSKAFHMGNQTMHNQMGQNTRNQLGQFVGNHRGQYIGNQVMGNQVGNAAAPVAGNYGNGNMNQGNVVKCFNCQGVGHMARNCPSRVDKKDPEYLQKALMLAQKQKAGFQLHAEEIDYMALMDDMEDCEDIDANCIFMANLQEAKYDTDSETPPVYDSNAVSEVPLNNSFNNYDMFVMSPHEERHSETQAYNYDTYQDCNT